MHSKYILRPFEISLILGILALYLALQSIFGEYMLSHHLHNMDSVPALLLDLFSVNAEQTIPTWYSTFLLLTAAGLFAGITSAKRATKDPSMVYWLGLAIIFLYLSLDEGVAIHEIAADALHLAFNTTGFFYFGWQIIAIPIVILFGVFYWRFWLRLPASTRYLFVGAALLYVGGALGVEGISANQFYVDGELTITYLALGTLEELGEMLGVVVLIYSLLAYIAQQQYQFTFHAATLPASPLTEASLPSATTILPAVSVGDFFSVPRLIHYIGGGLTIVAIIAFNVLVVLWGQSQDTLTIPAADNLSAPIYQALANQFSSDDIMITHMNRLFSSDDSLSKNYALALLTSFANVTVVSFPTNEVSVYFVSNASLPSINTISEWLQMAGEQEFMIFETAAVRMMIGCTTNSSEGSSAPCNR